MKKLMIIALSVIAISCTLNESNPYESMFANDELTCPKGHTDSIIEILYRMPTEESFLDTVSGNI
jgi:hypothetical protein